MLGCGSDEKPSIDPFDGRVSAPNNTTSARKSGGAFKSFVPFEPPSLDPMASSSVATYQAASLTYPRLLKFTTATFPDLAKGASKATSRRASSCCRTGSR